MILRDRIGDANGGLNIPMPSHLYACDMSRILHLEKRLQGVGLPDAALPTAASDLYQASLAMGLRLFEREFEKVCRARASTLA